MARGLFFLVTAAVFIFITRSWQCVRQIHQPQTLVSLTARLREYSLRLGEGQASPDSYQSDSFENITFFFFLSLDWLTVFTDGLASRWSGGPARPRDLGKVTVSQNLCFPISQAASSQGCPSIPEGPAGEDNVSRH